MHWRHVRVCRTACCSAARALVLQTQLRRVVEKGVQSVTSERLPALPVASARAIDWDLIHFISFSAWRDCQSQVDKPVPESL